MSKWKDCKNLLVIRLDNMGDLIMTNAALQEIKLQMPQCKITLLTSAMALPIVPYLGTVDESIQYDAPWMKLLDRADVSHTESLVAELRRSKFDGCLIFNVYSQNPMPAIMLAYLAGIPKRAAYLRENPYTLLTDWIPDKEPLFYVQHQISRDLALLGHVGISHNLNRLPELILPSKSETLTLPAAFNQRILLNLDVSEEKRRIPANVGKELIQELLNQGHQVVMAGKEDNDYLRSCRSDIRSEQLINLIGVTDIKQLLLLISDSDAVVSVNTGVAHIACALKKTILVLYAQTNPQHIPWSQNSDFILYPIPATMQSKNTINIFVDKKHSPAKTAALRVSVIMKKLGFLLEQQNRRADGTLAVN